MDAPAKSNQLQIISSREAGAGIYIHIPFCKQACHYCDFHFSTSLKSKSNLIKMICHELILRKNELNNVTINTIYFGGGTPSLMDKEDLQIIFDTLNQHFLISENAEITLEANPDDLTKEKLEMFSHYINRLSIGVQSFFEEDLVLMNRAHNATEALESILLAKQYFDNISIDLIYGIPGMSNSRWEENISIALGLELPHFSCYALTVEPNTALKKFIDKKLIAPVDDEVAKMHFDILSTVLTKNGYIQYEFSNYGKPGYFSQNNTAYWMGKSYLGIGPAAHSFNGEKRSWNISNNNIYIKSLKNNIRPFEEEILSLNDQFNEYIMTRLRTMWGINLDEIKTRFGNKYLDHLNAEIKPLIESGSLKIEDQRIIITQKAKFLSDGIASDLFMVE